MEQYINKAIVMAEIKKRLDKYSKLQSFNYGAVKDLESLLNFLDTLEVKEVDLKKESETIANGIMIAVQENKYHTCIYNPERCDFNHSHLWLAARKGIELGLKAKGERL